jgi:RsiW-degrading membrane proteinase PrsW (M82 family)
VLAIALALVPALAFLASLVLLDSFTLTSRRAVLGALAAGAGLALAAAALNGVATSLLHVGPVALSRYVAPVIEESLKAAFVLSLVARGRVGFLVDTLILAFATGTGFALLENLTYLAGTVGAPAALWLVRGVGTASLHAACAALAGLVAKVFADQERFGTGAALGLTVAIALHAAYNQFVLPPLVAAILLVGTLPLVVAVVLDRSERATRHWITQGFDADVDVLRALTSAEAGTSRIGQYLRALRTHVPGMAVADMFCLLRLELELSIRARGLLMAREAGMAAPVGDDIARSVDEIQYLRRQIGPTGLAALNPLRPRHRRADWPRVLLEAARTP